MEKDAANDGGGLPVSSRPRRPRRFWRRPLLAILAFTVLRVAFEYWTRDAQKSVHLPLHTQESLAKCKLLHTLPGPPPDFNSRAESDRFVPGTRPVHIKNATIWTGRVAGLEVVKGDVLLHKGLLKAVGRIPYGMLEGLKDVQVYDAKGAWVTPGIVDLHSHLGVMAAPGLSGSSDGNSRKGYTLPWLRSLDGLNTHDEAYKLSISGGVTTSLVLPGSANAMGGQAFVIKLRPTAERSPTSMLLEPPYGLNGSAVDPSLPPRWRQMKFACGENPKRVYSGVRMDSIWAMRSAFETARKIKVAQDDYCGAALAGKWQGLGEFPDDLQWEALVDILRGKTKVQNHCYETVDLNSMILMTQEFQFPIAAFHHAHETYLIPSTLKKAYGHPPAVALFATNARYKREAYRGTEFAPKILADAGISVVMKSDHPVLNSRHLVYEAQQAHYYGLGEDKALASVISTPAEIMGMGHRIGYLKVGYDADVVVWDSHPLALGATPKQIWIDGVQQVDTPYTVAKPAAFQKVPETPSWGKEINDTLKYEGLPPLTPNVSTKDVVMFTNVKSVYVTSGHVITESFTAQGSELGVAVAKDGDLVCTGSRTACMNVFSPGENVRVVDLEGGSLSPGIISFGSPLGTQEIQGEASTQDGIVYDPLLQEVPKIIGGDYALDRAVDGLQYATRDALLAYIRGGVTTGIVAPKGYGFLLGMSAAFSTGAAHKLEEGAVVQEEVAVHIRIGHLGAPSVSTQIAALRKLLTGDEKGPLAEAFQKVSVGKLTLVINVENADIMASLLRLKEEVENKKESVIRLTFVGASEAHLLADELFRADVGVILIPSRPFPGSWQSRRILPGPPLTERGAVGYLIAHDVTVGLGVPEQWAARNTRLDVAWASLEAGGEISKTDALALATVNIQKLLGLRDHHRDLVATRRGDMLDFESQVVGIISPGRGVVDLV